MVLLGNGIDADVRGIQPRRRDHYPNNRNRMPMRPMRPNGTIRAAVIANGMTSLCYIEHYFQSVWLPVRSCRPVYKNRVSNAPPQQLWPRGRILFWVSLFLFSFQRLTQHCVRWMVRGIFIAWLTHTPVPRLHTLSYKLLTVVCLHISEPPPPFEWNDGVLLHTPVYPMPVRHAYFQFNQFSIRNFV